MGKKIQKEEKMVEALEKKTKIFYRQKVKNKKIVLSLSEINM